MTWSRFDDAASKNPKATNAGNEAWALWCAAVMYCNRHLTDGHVSLAALANDCLPVPISVAKAKKLAEELCRAKVHPDKSGLFERGPIGYVVHDFLDWNPSKVDVEAKRRRDRDRKRKGDGGTPESEWIPRGIPPDAETESTRIPPGIRTDSATPAGAGAGARTRAPSPAQPYPAVPSQKAATAAVGGSEPPSKVPCPPDLELTPDQRASLGMHVPEWAIARITVEFVASAIADPEDRRTLVHWRKCLSRAVSGRWNDPSQRPKQPDDDAQRAEASRRASEIQAAREARLRRETDIRLGLDPDAPESAAPAPPMSRAELTRGIGGDP